MSEKPIGWLRSALRNNAIVGDIEYWWRGFWCVASGQHGVKVDHFDCMPPGFDYACRSCGAECTPGGKRISQRKIRRMQDHL